jgi:propionyl-CoA carboxylase beta chain
MNPYIAAEQGYIDDIINPAETRNVIIATLHLLENKHEGKRNRIGNIPL